MTCYADKLKTNSKHSEVSYLTYLFYRLKKVERKYFRNNFDNVCKEGKGLPRYSLLFPFTFLRLRISSSEKKVHSAISNMQKKSSNNGRNLYYSEYVLRRSE